MVAGLGRLKSVEKLGWSKIDAIVLKGDKDEMRLAEIAENLFRSELSVLERSEQITEWLAIVRRRAAHGDHPGGKQPHDRGHSKAARKLKLSRSMIGRSERIAGLSKEAKSAIREAKLDNDTRELVAIAKEKAPDEQVKKVEEFLKRKEAKRADKGKRRKNRKVQTTKQESSDLPKVESPDIFDNNGNYQGSDGKEEPTGKNSVEADFNSLKAAWLSSDCANLWASAKLSTRQRFAREVLRFSMKASQLGEGR